MLRKAREILTGGAVDFARTWASVAATDLAYKAVSFAVLAPAVALFIRWLISRTGTRVVADVDIARFFVTTPQGIVAIVLGGSLLGALTAVEMSCLMAIGLAAAGGGRLGARRALGFGAARAASVLRLVGYMILRVLAVVVPFALLAGLVYALLLRSYDINYYLKTRPPAFWAAAALVAVIAAGLAALLVRTIIRWTLALPLVLFEKVSPERALGASAALSAGRRPLIAIVLLAWAVFALLVFLGAKAFVQLVGRTGAPHAAGSLPLLLAFVTGLLFLWALFALAVSVVQSALFALIVVRLYRDARPSHSHLPHEAGAGTRVSKRWVAALAGVALAGAAGIALLALVVTRADREVLVIAHRGASAEAPENTLAAFRLAADERTDFVELDVQESSDGEVIVVHDSDLMKVAGMPGKIWERTSAEIRGADIGSRFDRRFAGERVPTLDEVFAALKGRTKIVVELKSYGHDQHLVERVAALVEAAGMERDCIFMSLDHRMVADLKRLRPQWRVGVLVAKALGDLTTLDADFLAVEARLVNARFVRRAHRAGMDVYAWTVNDPAWMLRVMSRGADGLITDKPALARRVIERRDKMSDVQRLLVALLIRSGARTDTLASMEALRP